MMYQFDFVCVANEKEYVVSVLAPTYGEAVKKIRAICLPNFDLRYWDLEGVYEIGTIIPSSN
jgi:hypothetical protein